MNKELAARCLILQYLSQCSSEDTQHREELDVAIECLKNTWEIHDFNYSIPNVHSLLDLIPTATYDTARAMELKQEGNALLKEGNLQGAMDKYTEAISVDPSQSQFYCNRAAVYTKLGDHNKAIEDCEKAISLTPTYANAYSRLGYAYYQLKDYEKAREAYKRGLRECPNNAGLSDSLNSLPPEQPKQSTPDLMSLLGNFAQNPQMIQKLMQGLQSPEVQRLLQDPEMQDLKAQIEQNPSAIISLLGDPRMQRFMEAAAAGMGSQ